MTTNHPIPSSHFSKKTLKALNQKGIYIIGSTYVPGPDGSFANGDTGYMLSDNETGKVRTFLQVLEMAK
jgi:hypothetical protein